LARPHEHHSHAHHAHGPAAGAVVDSGYSLLLMSIRSRLAIVALIVVVLWLSVAWALA
jgi:hypothetical protein